MAACRTPDVNPRQLHPSWHSCDRYLTQSAGPVERFAQTPRAHVDAEPFNTLAKVRLWKVLRVERADGSGVRGSRSAPCSIRAMTHAKRQHRGIVGSLSRRASRWATQQRCWCGSHLDALVLRVAAFRLQSDALRSFFCCYFVQLRRSVTVPPFAFLPAPPSSGWCGNCMLVFIDAVGLKKITFWMRRIVLLAHVQSYFEIHLFWKICIYHLEALA